MARKKTIDIETKEYIVIKKYANRRLYNTDKSHYVTLENLAELIRSGVNFVVYDAKTGEDITRSILTQIIAEQEAKGKYLLPISFLKEMIKIYGNDVNGLVPDYWDHSMKIFKENREKLQQGFDRALQRVVFPLEQLSKVADTNHELFSKSVEFWKKFTPKNMYMPETITVSKQEYQNLNKEIERLRSVEAEFEALKKAAKTQVSRKK